MSELKELMRLKEKAEKMRKERDKAEGAMALRMKQLKNDFGCSTLEEAKELLTKLQRKEKKAKQNFDTAVAEFKETWKDQLEDDDD